MCLTIVLPKSKELETFNSALKKIVKIARKDIKCYKVVRRTKIKGKYKSLITNFNYQLGYHYYQTGKKFKGNVHFFKNKYYILIDDGLHSFAKMPKNFINTRLVVVKCIIPKGSEYFVEKDDKGISKFYCSDNLILIEEIKQNLI